MSTIKQIAQNMFTGWMAIVIRAGIAFFMVPFLLTQLGRESYGLIGILSVLIGFSQVADFGLRRALGRELAEKSAKADMNDFNELTNTAFLLYLVISIILAIVLIILAPWFTNVFNIPDNLKFQAIYLIRLYGASTLILSFVTPTFSAVLTSNHRYDVVNTINMLIGVVFSLAIFVFVSLASNKLYAWAYVMLIDKVALLIFMYLFAKKYVKKLKVSYNYVNFRHLKSLAKLGGYLYSLRLTELLSQSSDPLVISYFFGPAGVALYQPGTRLSHMFRPVVCTLANQLYPLTTKQHVSNNELRMQQLLVFGTKYTLLLGVLAVVGIISLAYPLCRLWLGDSLGADYKVVAIILIGWAVADFMAYASGSQFAVLLGKKHLKFLMWTQLPSAFVNLALSIFLVGYTSLGIPGVLVATVAIGLIRRPILIWHTANVCGMRTIEYFMNSYSKPLLMMSALGMIAYLIRTVWTPSTWQGIILFAVNLTIVWLVLSWFIVIGKFEKEHLMAVLRRRTGRY